jgi:cell wall-associated NlpC family hydrolase
MYWLRLSLAYATFAVFISLAAVALPAEAAQADPRAVPIGEQYLGTPYGAYGLDCSGFTKQVYGELGVWLPDSPSAQYYGGYGYYRQNPRRGDLVFFDEHGTGISHAAIYVGHGTILHASTYYGEVVESPMYYIPGYVGAVDPY